MIDLPARDGTPLLAYENFSDNAEHTAVSRADVILSDGWDHAGKYPLTSITPPIWWNDENPAHRSWTFLKHCWDMLNDVLHAHSVSRERRFLDAAIELALDWIAQHPLDSDPDDTSFAWYDMAVGLRAQRLAYLLDAYECEADADSVVRTTLWRALDRHRVYLDYERNIVYHNNHGFYQAAGQLAMGRRFRGRSEAMDLAYRQGGERLRKMIATQFGEDGVHKEHSPDYHRMVYDTLKAVIVAGLVSDPEVIELADKAERALAWFVLPNGTLVNFGDSDARRITRKPRDAQRKWRTDEMLFVASKAVAGAPPAATCKTFEHAGYFIARDRWPSGPDDYPNSSYLAQAAAFHSRTHKHADDLTFVWYDRDHEIIVDAGRFGYLGKTKPGSDLWEQGNWYADPRRVYCESTRAHNVVEIDGRDYPRKGVRPYGSAIIRAGKGRAGVYFCESEVRLFKSIRLARVVFFLPGKWLIVLDWVHDNNKIPHDYRQWFHLHPGVSLIPAEAGFACSVPTTSQPLRIVSLTGAVPLKAELGNEGAKMQGFYSPSEQTLIPAYAVGFAHFAQPAATFATLFSFSDQLTAEVAESMIAVSGRSGVLKWTDALGGHDLRFTRPATGDFSLTYACTPLPEQD